MAKFEPASKWDYTDKVDTLSIKVPGFKREQLKVQVDSSGSLRVSGQGGDGRQQFSKDFRVPEGCNLGGIRARFDSDSETLVITLPKDEKAAATPAATAAAAAGPADKAETQKARQEKPTEPAAADKGAAASDAGAAAGAGRRRLGMRGPGRAILVYTVVGVLVLVLAGACFYLSYELRKATAGEKKIVMGVPE